MVAYENEYMKLFWCGNVLRQSFIDCRKSTLSRSRSGIRSFVKWKITLGYYLARLDRKPLLAIDPFIVNCVVNV